MTPDATIVVLFAIPIVLLMVLRINAALVFLSLCLGDVLVQFTGKDVTSIVTGASLQAHTTDNMVRLALLLLPADLTMIFMIRTVRGSRQLFNLLPAIGTGLLTMLLVVPLLSPGLAHNVLASSLWRDAQNSQSTIVGFSAVTCLLFLWLQRPKAEHGKRHKG